MLKSTESTSQYSTQITLACWERSQLHFLHFPCCDGLSQLAAFTPCTVTWGWKVPQCWEDLLAREQSRQVAGRTAKPQCVQMVTYPEHILSTCYMQATPL